MDYSSLETEKCNPLSYGLDEMTAEEIVEVMNKADSDCISAVRSAISAIADAVNAACEAISHGGRVIYVGAGTSGRLGVLDASECPPTFGVPSDMFTGIIAGGDTALRNSVEGAEDSYDMGYRAITDIAVSQYDFVIVISASGTANFCFGAVDAAKAASTKTGCIVCNADAKLIGAVDVPVILLTGREVLAGSTRLKAGTATKMALNMISTGAMALFGKTYGNYMVDVRATNIKLSDRCVRIVMEAANVSRDTAEALIKNADGNLKIAVIMSLTGADKYSARTALSNMNGHVNLAIRELKKGTENDNL